MKDTAVAELSAWMPPSKLKARRFPRTELFTRPDRLGQPSVEDLAHNINRKGMLWPIVIDHNNNVVSGDRRLQAVTTHLGWETVPVIQGDFLTVVQAIIAENGNPVLQLPMTLSEMLKLDMLLDGMAGPYRQLTYRKAVGKEDSDGPTRREIRAMISAAVGVSPGIADTIRQLRYAYLDPDIRSGMRRSDSSPDLARRIIEDDAAHMQQPYRARDLYIRALEKQASTVGTAKMWRDGVPALLSQLNALGVAISGLNAIPQGLKEEEVREWQSQLAGHMRVLQQLKNRFAAYHEGA